MKTFLLCASLFISVLAIAQTAPGIQWQKSYGGTQDDVSTSMQPTKDGGYVIAGYSNSNNGNVSGNHGGFDYWVAKVDKTGNMQWQKSLGGSGDDEASSIQQTSDSGYIVAGYTTSVDGDITGNHGNADYWVVKLDKNGSVQWQKAYGGTNDDRATAIQQTTDGGYIVTGSTASNNGDMGTIKGATDYWVIKLTSTGAITWQHNYGGSKADDARSIQQTTDGGYIVAGSTYSFDGDVTGHYKSPDAPTDDAWIVKLTSTGVIQWAVIRGGTFFDGANYIRQTPDGGYIMLGYSNSHDGDRAPSGEPYSSMWLVKLNSTGGRTWQKPVGFSADRSGKSIQPTADGGYVVIGTTNQDGYDVHGNHGNQDMWVAKLNSAGTVIWQRPLGGNYSEQGSAVWPLADGSYVAAGHTASNNYGDVGPNHNESSFDFWLVKLGHDTRVNITTNVFNQPGQVISVAVGTKVNFTANTATGVTSPVYQWKRNNTNVGTNSAAYSDSLLQKGDSVYCILTANGKTDTSNILVFNVYVTITVTTNTSTNICDSVPVTFTAAITGAVQSPVYHWKKNVTNVGTNSATYKDSTLHDGDSVYCVVTSTGRSDTSNITHFTVYHNYQPVITITGSNSFCAGTKASYRAVVSNTGTVYHLQWKKNGVNVGSDSLFYSTTTLQNGDSVWCIVTSNTGCVTSPATASNKIKVTVNAYALPTINIATTPAHYRFCSTAPAISLTFHASVKNGGGTPVYQWKKNGINAGTNSSTYTDSLHNGDSVWCVFTSSAKCITANNIISNKVKITITLPVTPSVTVTPLPAGAICLGTPVRFKASVKNGGSVPHYQWKKNNTNVGTDSDTYNDSALFNNDSVWCVFTSNAECTVGNPAASNKIKQAVNNNPPLKPSPVSGPANVTANQHTLGYSVNLVNNVSYVWTVPAGCTIVNGQGTEQVIVNWGTASGSIIVRAKNACGQSDSSKLLVHVTSSFSSGADDGNTGSEDALKTAGKEGIQLYPNPAVNTAYIKFNSPEAGKYFIQVIDAQGRVLQTKEANTVKGTNKLTVDVSHYAQGLYFIRLAGSNKQQSLRLLIQR